MRFQLRVATTARVDAAGLIHVALGAAGTFPVVTLSRAVEPRHATVSDPDTQQQGVMAVAGEEPRSEIRHEVRQS